MPCDSHSRMLGLGLKNRARQPWTKPGHDGDGKACVSNHRENGLAMPDLLASVAEMIPWMQSRAGALDRTGTFPADEIERLRLAGALAPPLPIRESAAADTLASLWSLVGQGNLSVGRILEAHVNALHLIARYGTWHPGMTAGCSPCG
jgi:hypothetical protein